MLSDILVLCAGLSLAAVIIRCRVRTLRRRRALEKANDNGVVMDIDSNIDAEMSYARMLQKEEDNGRRFTGKQARFMELLRVVAEGPRTIDEIRFLFEEGIGPVVRPDGVVYVPCIENEHLSVEGEVELEEEDLDRYVAQGLISSIAPAGKVA